uniref:Retrovirus-related Pol polyprotein from transposon TNT 1-94 n=1 Tax=Cajanus cajan TaxID=3821 RepID=A0A151RB36_CAJCA|nr:Retrovirus-related Pol polyprotein from transposon TNT 1-94 [Cajanus cajan]
MASNTVNFSSVPLPVFTSENFDLWKLKLKLWDIVQSGYTKPDNTITLSKEEQKKLEDCEQKDAQALFVLQQAVGETIARRIMNADTAKKAWDILEEEFEGNEQVRSVKLHYLRREFETIKMKESKTIEEYYGRIKEIVNKMKLYGKEIKEKRVVEKILITLIEKYDSIVASIETSSDPSSLSVNKLVGLLGVHSEEDYIHAHQSTNYIKSRRQQSSIVISPESPRIVPQQEESSLESTPRRVRSLVDIYETCNLAILEPGSFEEAANQEVWVKAMEEEIKMIEKNNTWELVDYPYKKDIIGVKWVYKTKLNPDGTIQKHKARLVAKGYSQQPGVDYNETFAPVTRLDTIRALIALAAHNGWNIYQLDVKSAFLNGVLEEQIYVEQPLGFVIKGHEGKVLRLKKALYGLKQAPRAWYSKTDQYLPDNGLRRRKSEPTLYIKTQGQHTLLLSLYM